jgi:hypothetical protein
MSDEKTEAAKAEVHRLLEARFIEPIAYLTWLTNIVMVRRRAAKCRMCIDFTSLNKACPKDNFPLPRIDKIVDSAAGCEVMSLLDCFSGYHQIYMKEEDKASTSFITPFDTYCFVRMPEGLKNVDSTFFLPHQEGPREPSRPQHLHLCRRHCRRKQKQRGPPGQPRRDIRQHARRTTPVQP